MNSINHQIRLAARPIGLPKPSDWELTEEPVPVPGRVGGRDLLSVGRSGDAALIAADYRVPIALGEAMEAGPAGQVTASRHPGFAGTRGTAVSASRTSRAPTARV